MKFDCETYRICLFWNGMNIGLMEDVIGGENES